MINGIPTTGEVISFVLALGIGAFSMLMALLKQNYIIPRGLKVKVYCPNCKCWDYWK